MRISLQQYMPHEACNIFCNSLEEHWGWHTLVSARPSVHRGLMFNTVQV